MLNNSYIIQIKNNNLISKSSSGGMFAELAKYILARNGIVFGCAMERLEEGFDVKHIYIEKEEDLYKLQGSKYVQSNLGKTIKQAKEFLEQGRFVLFSGTPCQIAGLKAYLRKDYDNLLTVDLSCTGTPSQKLFNDFIKFLENKYKKKIIKFEFRNKEKLGWACGNALITLENGEQKILHNNVTSFLYFFMNGISEQERCYTCKYAGLERISDITIADAWGIEQEYPELLKTKLDKNKGISLVLINTEKGENFFEKLQDNVIYNRVNINLLKKYNHPLRHPSIKNVMRDKYLEEYKKYGYVGLDNFFKKNLGWKYYYKILQNHTPKFIKNFIKLFVKKQPQKFDSVISTWAHLKNYGAILTGYALKKTINNLGYSAKLLKFADDDKSIAKPFNDKYCIYTEKMYLAPTDMSKLSEITNTYIVGSDNQFNLNTNHKYIYLPLAFYLPKEMKKVSISTSMSLEEIAAPEIEISTMKTLLKRFDYLSVREYNGVDIMKETFDCKADWVIDPVFYLDKQEYIDLAQESKVEAKDKILTYVLYPTEDTNKILDDVKNKYGNNIIDFAGNEVSVKSIENKHISVENWLKAIIDSKIIVTDSFHCVCFALIFNKPFVCIKNTHGFIRFKSLFKMFDLHDNVTESSKKIIYNENYNYDKIQNIIEEKSDFVKNKLVQILTEPKVITKEQEEAEIELKKIPKKELYVNFWYKENKLFYYAIIVPFVKPIKKLIRESKCKK
ncbi:MAG: hypothetical protein E7Z90_06970 [Cyanobacteria bacterium SIG29]|nr:hypothetical protein [Cyanobacteria bacterium SIG29]